MNKQQEIEVCAHEWETIDKGKRVKGAMQAGLFTDGYVAYEMVYLQECKKCKKLNATVF